MCSVLKIPVNPTIALLYEECKVECKFNAKSDADFLLFLLNSAVQILSIVKDFSPVLESSNLDLLTNNTAQCGELNESSIIDDLNNMENIDITDPPLIMKITKGNSNLAEDYQAVLLEQIEMDQDLSKLQQYIETVQSIKIDDESEISNNTSLNDENNDEDTENRNTANRTSTNDINQSIDKTKSSEDNKFEFDNIAKKIETYYTAQGGSLNPSSATYAGTILEELTQGRPDFVCSICKFNFASHHGLSRHIRSGVCVNKEKYQERLYVCNLCDATLSSQKGLTRHQKRSQCRNKITPKIRPAVLCLPPIQKKPPIVNQSDLPDHSDVPDLYECTTCSYKFSTKAALSQHEKSQRCFTNQCSTSKQSSFICHICNASLASKAGLQKHLRRQQCRLYKCKDCEVTFRYVHELKSHVKIHQRSGKSVTAESALTKTFGQSVFGMGLPSMTNLVSKPNIPIFISKSEDSATATTSAGSSTTTQLRRQYSCTLCNFSTPWKHHLTYHMKVHSGKKPFKCSKCDYAAVTQGMLNSHISKIHPGARLLSFEEPNNDNHIKMLPDQFIEQMIKEGMNTSEEVSETLSMEVSSNSSPHTSTPHPSSNSNNFREQLQHLIGQTVQSIEEVCGEEEVGEDTDKSVEEARGKSVVNNDIENEGLVSN